jgi:CubicO group peptidase (beta-lactamase class C family)
MRDAIDSGRYLGAVTLVSRHGRIVDWRAWGHRDLARTARQRRDDIFRIYSLTKTVATVAVLMLSEEGRLALDDPIGRDIAELGDRPVPVRHQLTHTSGLGQATQPMERAADLRAYAALAAALPQVHSPGTRFEYASVNTELASRVVEVASGKPFDRFLEERLFAPLAMRDTGFAVIEAARHRIAAMTSTDASGRLIEWPAMDARSAGDRLRRYTSGAGGLYSTAADFARFAHMLMAGGELDGRRILTSASVESMFTNQLVALNPPTSQYGEGFGLGGFVSLDDPKRARPGSVGAFGWSGAASTYFMIDRKQGVVAILFMQHEPQGLASDPGKLSFRFYDLVYQSLAQPPLPR